LIRESLCSRPGVEQLPTPPEAETEKKGDETKDEWYRRFLSARFTRLREAVIQRLADLADE
jgi:hypothetical protein